MVLLVFLVVAVLLGLVTGGSFARLSHVRVRGATAVLLVYVLQAFTRNYAPQLGFVRPDSVVWIWSLLTLTLVALTARNARLIGMPIVTLGLVLNLAVVVLNAGMPVGRWQEVAGRPPAAVVTTPENSAFYRAPDAQTRLLFLGDVIPLRGPSGSRFLLSVGDLLLFLGVSVIVLAGMHRAIGPQVVRITSAEGSD